MKTKLVLTCLFLAVAPLAIYACDDDNNGSVIKETVDSGTPKPGTDAGNTTPGTDSGTTTPDGGFGYDCFEGTPTTHLEIINACTKAQRIDKKPTLSKLLSDGGLPPIGQQ